MSDPIPEADVPNLAERAEARAIRRRWITLGEAVAVAAVAISALTFWSNYSEHREADAEKKAEKSEVAEAAARVTLSGTPVDHGAALALSDAREKIQGVRVRFPSALGLSARESLVEPKIEAEWFSHQLLELTDGGPDTREGTLPVLITADWWDGEAHRSETALYDIVWHTEGRLLRGRELKLKGLVLRRRLRGDGPAQLDATWLREKPKA